MHRLLEGQAGALPSRRPLLGRKTPLFEVCSLVSWAEAVINAQQQIGAYEWLLMDDASAIPDHFLPEVIGAIRAIKNAGEGLMRGVLLFGAHTLRMAVNAANQ